MENNKIKMYTRCEVSEMLHVSKSTLMRWSKNGYLPSCRLGGRVMYRADVIENRFFSSSRNSQ